MKLRCSPYYILVFARKFALLLLALPVQTLLMIDSETHTKVFFIIFDIVVAGIILLCAFVSRHSQALYVTTSRFILKKGFLHKQNLIIPTAKLESLHISRSLLQRLFGISRITLVSSNAKGEIYLGKKQLGYLFCHCKAPQTICIFKPTFANILIMCAGISPALGAALSFAPLVRSISNLSADELIASANLWERLGYNAIPPLLAAISSLLFIFWLAGLCLSFLRYYGLSLSLCKHNEHLLIKRGLISKYSLSFMPKNIKAVILRQSLFMLMLRRKRAEFVIANNDKNTIATAGCTCNNEQTQLILGTARLESYKDIHSTKICPSYKAQFSYTLLPLLSLLSLSLLSIFISHYSPYRIEPHLGVFLALWGCIWFLHRYLSFCRASVSFDGNILHMHTRSKLSLIDVFIPAKHIRCIKISRNIFQRFKDTCNMRVFIKSSRRKSFVIHHISAKKAAELTKKLCD